MLIDLFYPYVPKEAIEAVVDVLRSRFIGQGPKVDQFEKEFKKFFRQKNCVSVNSGTAALETAYDLIGLKEGDEVISTPLTCTATNLPLIRRGVKIVWADILESTLCIDPDDAISKIKEGKTKAIVQVHLGGIKAELNANRIYDLCVPIVSDACQALGIFNGDYTCCSFQAIKQITTIDGGMLVCPDEKTAHDAKLLRWFGIDREKKIANNWQAYRERKMTFDIELPGTKRHMNDVAAAMGIVGLKHYYQIIDYNRYLFNIYQYRLKNIDGIKIIDGDMNTHWLFTVLVERRDDFAKMLFEADVDTNVVQVRNDIYKIFGGERADLPVMNKVEEKYCSLPIGMHVTEDNVNYICDMIQKGW
jgi:perosamine synthetase